MTERFGVDPVASLVLSMTTAPGTYALLLRSGVSKAAGVLLRAPGPEAEPAETGTGEGREPRPSVRRREAHSAEGTPVGRRGFLVFAGGAAAAGAGRLLSTGGAADTAAGGGPWGLGTAERPPREPPMRPSGHPTRRRRGSPWT